MRQSIGRTPPGVDPRPGSRNPWQLSAAARPSCGARARELQVGAVDRRHRCPSRTPELSARSPGRGLAELAQDATGQLAYHMVERTSDGGRRGLYLPRSLRPVSTSRDERCDHLHRILLADHAGLETRNCVNFLPAARDRDPQVVPASTLRARIRRRGRWGRPARAGRKRAGGRTDVLRAG